MDCFHCVVEHAECTKTTQGRAASLQGLAGRGPIRLLGARYDRVPGTDHFVNRYAALRCAPAGHTTGVAGSGVLHGACGEIAAVLAL